MSEQIWHRCDFPNCDKIAAWKITRPPKPTNERSSIEWAIPQQFTPPPMEEWCQEHALLLVQDREAFITSLKAAA